MTAPFDAKQDLADAPVTGARLRPKDAATPIVVRRGRTPAVLMGRRAHGHVFMASKWVFPGGRIDRSDFRAAFTGDFDARTAARLAHGAPPARARALALAAVRETFEETGLVVGRAAPPASVAGSGDPSVCSATSCFPVRVWVAGVGVPSRWPRVRATSC